QYLDLLLDIQKETGVALIFVTHNLGIVAKMCNRMAVMYAGRIVEMGAVRDFFDAPKHPYTRALLGLMAKLGRKAPPYAMPGQPPDLARPPPGCAFHPRCTDAEPRCAKQDPDYVQCGKEWTVRCWLPQSAPEVAHDHAGA